MLSIIRYTFILCTIKGKKWPIKLWHKVLMRVLNRIWMNQSHKSYCFHISFIYSERRGNLHSLQSHCLLCDGGKKTCACVSATKCNRLSATRGYLSSFICSCKALDGCIARKYRITTLLPMANICCTNIRFAPCCSVSRLLWEHSKCSFQCQIML